MDFNNYDIVADLYDTYVPMTYDVDFFVHASQEADGEVLELMSGTGRVSLPLLEAGVKLTCVDISSGLNAVLRKKLAQRGLRADVYDMDVCQLDLPRQFGMVIIPFSSFAHIVSLADQQEVLRRIYRHLLPGGTLICTLGNPALRRGSVDGQLRLAYTYPLADQGKLLLWIVEEFDQQDKSVVHALQFYEEYEARGKLSNKRLMELHFRLTTQDEFERMALAAGFSIQKLYGDFSYADFDEHTSPFMIWVLQKQGN